MRKLIASTFASLDGVMQAPGGPEEDPTGGFTLGGWMFAHREDVSMDISASGIDQRRRDEHLCTGRRHPPRFLRECRAGRVGVGATQ
jgi:hypothetical protein